MVLGDIKNYIQTHRERVDKIFIYTVLAIMAFSLLIISVELAGL